MSWKTTVCGVLGFVVASGSAVIALLDGDVATNPQWEVVVASLMTMIGLFTARDNDVSSEDAGVK